MTSAARRLAGRRIVITRPRAQAGELRSLLEAAGAEVVEVPAIRIEPPADMVPVDQAIARLDGYRWIVFTSPNGVAALAARMRALGRDPAELGRARLAAIGPGTAAALAALGLRADLAPEEFRAEALVAALARHDLRGARVLVPRAAVARPVLPDGLRDLGAEVDVVAVYRTVAAPPPPPDVRDRLLAGGFDAVTFTSSSTVRRFVEMVGADALRRVLVACIGPITAETARVCGLRVGAVALPYTPAALVAALEAALPPRARAR